MKPRVLAFYLPQYHPTTENNRWWGNGFTEWRNVARAKPLFSGHYQPHIPADLGYYDLRVPEVRQQQASLAAQYGLEGFCYYHYWFHGKQLLGRPLSEIIASGKPEYPFCLCWANESWSRRWIGDNQDILIKQEYSEDDDFRHSDYLARIFSDKRYVKIGGRPLFLIYRPHDLPNSQRTLSAISAACTNLGISHPYFVGVDAHRVGYDFRRIGFDAVLAFSPQLGVSAPDAFIDGRRASKLLRNLCQGVASARLKLFDEASQRSRMEKIVRPFPYIPSCFVSWDNSPRRGTNGIVYKNSSPILFEQYLHKSVTKGLEHPDNHGLVFINAWNEWAEGNHLEPDLRSGHAYLEACHNVIHHFSK